MGVQERVFLCHGLVRACAVCVRASQLIVRTHVHSSLSVFFLFPIGRASSPAILPPPLSPACAAGRQSTPPCVSIREKTVSSDPHRGWRVGAGPVQHRGRDRTGSSSIIPRCLHTYPPVCVCRARSRVQSYDSIFTILPVFSIYK